MKPGELSPDGRLRIRDPVELGWDVVETLGEMATRVAKEQEICPASITYYNTGKLAEVIELPIKQEPDDIVA